MDKVMQENMDRADFIFFKSRIDSLNIEPTYTQRLFSIFDKALLIFDRIENDLELQYLLCLSIWKELSIICNLLFVKRDDEFFNTLRALEYEFTGRTLLLSLRCGWIVEESHLPKKYSCFLDISI
jgi:hypothetical protein